MGIFIKTNSEIRSEALQKLKGKFMVFGLVTILIAIIQGILNNIPYSSIIIAPFFTYLYINLSLRIIDNDEISVGSVVDFKGRAMQILIGGLIIQFIGFLIFLVINMPLVLSIGFDNIFRLFIQSSYQIDNLKNVFFTTRPIILLCLFISIITLIYFNIRVSFFYGVIRDEDISAVEAIKKTFELTKGNVFRIIAFQLYFIGIAILMAIVVFIFKFLMIIILLALLIFIIFWFSPFVSVANANLYRTVASEKNIDENSSITNYIQDENSDIERSNEVDNINLD